MSILLRSLAALLAVIVLSSSLLVSSSAHASNSPCPVAVSTCEGEVKGKGDLSLGAIEIPLVLVSLRRPELARFEIVFERAPAHGELRTRIPLGLLNLPPPALA